ncbi:MULTISPECIES: phosphoenolpyruvate--protein phosphotransferase [unclassified Sphingopyxis]|uniref:phosphoenolpyruvate--protein phosphotransferase n=1 Tax=unclassified Sphingopyxis TaxID=2614943 RepID=UPI0006C68FB2|nr:MULTISPECIES: phosphoenolpyruvate--protein phosphotransferase [unclassified Sphingopyxis]USI75625.1 phosphoenolpyruvate--protein phosphotransferase [Sphingopyxis sp. USTB-05]GAO77861.1 phosphoenolpyruvate-protein phosphotransferase of PTS system [Sphingopyxis sp. C-1]
MSLIITSPLRGWATTLDSVPDPVFAQRMMGDGVAIQPLGDTVVAPFDGEVVTLHDAGHAISLRSAEGAEVLIHIGLDTVMLKGEGFTPLVAIGDKVSRGDPLIRFDLDAVALAATSLITPVIVTNADAFAISRRTVDCSVGACEALMTLVPVQAEARRRSDDGTVVEQAVTLSLPHGIHARPAARIGETARGFEADIHLLNGDKRGDARSTVALLALGTRLGDEVLVQARGADAEAALAAIVALLATDMGESAPAALVATAGSVEASLLRAGQIGGVIASPGLAKGPAARLRQVAIAVARDGNGASAERSALRAARDDVRGRIAARADDAEGSVAAVMHAHVALLDDPELLAGAEKRIAEGRSAGFAWRGAIHDQIDAIRATGNAHLIERADDLVDIERQLLAALTGTSLDGTAVPAGAIVVAEDLLPSQLLTLAAAKPAGLCLVRGGPTSHVAILCAGLGLPALVAMGDALDNIEDGTPLLLDAELGHLTANPGTVDDEAFTSRLAKRYARRAAAQAAASDACQTADGARIEIFANIGTVEDAAVAAAQGAEGSGLVRSEFLFLDRDTAPSEEEQYAAYQGIADALAGKPVIIRLLDIGGDKPAGYIPFAHEENPALGQRGIRVALAQPILLETQLRAILRVAPVGQCRIMIPMVASVDELRQVRAIVDRLRGEMGIASPVEVGVMVETPAAAMTADLLATEADFLSIGTNDLTQYVLAMDRGNPAVAAGVDAMHPAVLRMIGETCRLAAPRGRWVGVCGGLASDPAALPILIGLGVTELSAVPGFVAEAKQIVRGLTRIEARAHAELALQCKSAAEVRALARAFEETRR